MARDLWINKHQPQTIDQYVFRDQSQKRSVEAWVKDGGIPHLMLSGQAGLGKTALVNVLLNELEVDRNDVLTLNGSAENGVDEIRDRVMTFISMMPFGDYRYVFIDECDYLTFNAQAALRNVMDTYSNTARFIFTCNYPHKVFSGLKSRCHAFNFVKLDRDTFTERVLHILLQEGVELVDTDIDLVDTYISATYPDMRQCLMVLQDSIEDGKVKPLVQADVEGIDDYMIRAISLLKKSQYTEARKIICSNMRAEDVDKIFTFAYQNLNLWSENPENQEAAILIIRDAMAKAPLCADQEINISAMLVELQGVCGG
jgi:replication factor C small subunit